MEHSPEIELLLTLDEAYFAPDPESGKRVRIERFQVGLDTEVRHHAMAHDFSIDEEEIRLLDAQGMVDVEWLSDHTAAIRVTPLGHQTARAMRRLTSEEEPEEGATVSLDWENVAKPTLEAAHALWMAHGAPPEGIPTPSIARQRGKADNDPETFRAVALLTERGYLNAPTDISANDAPALVTVSSLGLEIVDGWPATSAEARMSRLSWNFATAVRV